MTDNDMCSGATNVGRIRENNQDQFLVAQLRKSMLVGSSSLPIDDSRSFLGNGEGQLMVVADGMGGHAAGEKASSMAIQLLTDQLLNRVRWFFTLNDFAEYEFVESLKSMLRETHHRIQEEGRRTASMAGMGTTLTMAYLVWPKLYVLHAGDSRCYLIRNQVVQRLTTDHTLARRMIESGGMKAEDEARSRWSNVLWNVLGGRSGADLVAEVRSATLQEGDEILLCSDGLHRHIDDKKIIEVLRDSATTSIACEAFIKIANDAGGDDNVTVIVARPEPLAGLASTWTSDDDMQIDNVMNYENYNPHDTLPAED